MAGDEAATVHNGDAVADVLGDWITSGSTKMSPMVMRGLSDENGSWSIICIRVRR